MLIEPPLLRGCDRAVFVGERAQALTLASGIDVPSECNSMRTPEDLYWERGEAISFGTSYCTHIQKHYVWEDFTYDPITHRQLFTSVHRTVRK